MSNGPNAPPPKRRSLHKRVVLLVVGALLAYVVVAYVLVPALWIRKAHRHPGLEDLPGITYTIDDIPGDPINVALVGSKEEVVRGLLAAQWHPADPLTLSSCVEMALTTVLKRSFEDAPVSNLYLFGRKEQLAFEQQVGTNPKHRHHVRFWQAEKVDATGSPAWVGSATYDKGIGLSHTTGQVTHHIAADVDAERDHLIGTLETAGVLIEVYFVDNFHKTREGRNGGGDPWHTDGRLRVGVTGGKRDP